MANLFQKAIRSQKLLRLLLRGPSGSGKTYSALVIAKELANGGKIALVDTEKLSSTHYTDLVDYDVVDYSQVFKDHNPLNYIKLIDMAEENKYKVLVIDSITHSWIGKGGMLEINDRIAEAKYRGNSYTAWNETTSRYYQPFVDKLILNNDLHIIATGRTKTEYQMDRDGEGRLKITKVGTKTQQREGLDYEFDIVLNLLHQTEGLVTPDKDRTGLFPTDGEQVTAATGKKIVQYLAGAKKPKGATAKSLKSVIGKAKDQDELKMIFNGNKHLEESKEFIDLLRERKLELMKKEQTENEK